MLLDVVIKAEEMRIAVARDTSEMVLKRKISGLGISQDDLGVDDHLAKRGILLVLELQFGTLWRPDGLLGVDVDDDQISRRKATRRR